MRLNQNNFEQCFCGNPTLRDVVCENCGNTMFIKLDSEDAEYDGVNHTLHCKNDTELTDPEYCKACHGVAVVLKYYQYCVEHDWLNKPEFKST